jgi:hypothetical protein
MCAQTLMASYTGHCPGASPNTNCFKSSTFWLVPYVLPGGPAVRLFDTSLLHGKASTFVRAPTAQPLNPTGVVQVYLVVSV